MFEIKYTYKGIKLGSYVILKDFPNIPLKVIGFYDDDYYAYSDICLDVSPIIKNHDYWDLSIRYDEDFYGDDYIFLKSDVKCKHAWFFNYDDIKHFNITLLNDKNKLNI